MPLSVRKFLAAAAAFLLASAAHVRAEAATIPTTGEIRTAVVLVNFSDNPAQPKSKAEVHDLVFGATSDYFWEASYQKTFLGGDTFGWFTMPFPGSQCSWPSVVQEGNRAAAAAGANLASYTQVVYLFPSASGCVSGGGGDIGPDGQRLVFVNGAAGFSVIMIAHEMGHGLGLLHSDALDCDATPLGSNCVVRGYTDTADTMGSDGHFNAFQKERLGWLNGAGTPTLTTVSASGRYSIQPYETATAGAKALKVLKQTDPVTGQKTWYYVEYRQAIGYDVLLANRGNMTSGVMVRTGTISPNGIATSLLLDMTPNSHSWIGVDFEDGALGVGRTFTDPASGVSITLVAADANGATLDVSVNAAPAPSCVRNAPTVTLTGPTAALAAGTQAAYTVAVANRDSSACAATNFALARSIPSGWTGTLDASSLALAPGASGSTVLRVASPASAAAGSYGIGVGTSSTVGGVHTASASGTYSVAAAATNLSDSVATDKASYMRGETVAMSALVKRDGLAVAGAAVKFTLTLPGGGTTVVNATSGSDGYARGSYKLGKAKNTIGTWALRADATLSGASASATTTFSVR